MNGGMTMGNKPGVRHYFAEGLTSRGYISLLPNMMPNWSKIYVLLGGAGSGKSTMLKMLGLDLLDRGYEVDFLRSARDPDSIAGFSLPCEGLAAIDICDVAPFRWRAPGIIEKFIDYTVTYDQLKLIKVKSDLLETERNLCQLQLELEDELAEQFGSRPKHKPFRNYSSVSWIFNNLQQSDEERISSAAWLKVQTALQTLQKSAVTSCFLHGLSSDGWINLAPHFLTDFDQIRLEGEDTSEALSWILKEAELLGQIIEIVLHPLNPDEVVGIAFPKRNLAIWQGNPEVLAEQGLLELPGKLKETLTRYQHQKSLLKSFITDAVDFEKLDRLREGLLNQVLRDLEIHS